MDRGIDAATLRRIHQVRAEVRLRDARPNDGRCGHVSEALEAEFGWQRRSGYLKLLDGTVSWVHCWNLLDDRSIVDATADQFQDLWLGDVIMIDAASPLISHYLHAPRKWQLTVTVDDHGPSVTCVSDQEIRRLSAGDSGRPWLSLARELARLLTGWELHDQVAELIARILRAKAASTEPIPSADLIHPLILQASSTLASDSPRRGSPPSSPNLCDLVPDGRDVDDRFEPRAAQGCRLRDPADIGWPGDRADLAHRRWRSASGRHGRGWRIL